MKQRRRARRRDEPFAEALSRNHGHAGQRQAQRLTHRLIRRTRRQGHHELADWLADGFRTGRLTADGAEADPATLARTLAAVRIRDFVDAAAQTGTGEHGTAILSFDRMNVRGQPVASAVTVVDLLDVEPGELLGTLRAATFGLTADGPWHRLRYMGLCELAPDPHAGAAAATLDLWDSLPPDDRSQRLLPDRPSHSCRSTVRVRFGWCDRDDDIHLARLEQALAIEGSRRDASTSESATPRLVLAGPPVLTPVPESRRAADRWDRLMLDGFVINRTVGDLASVEV